jgi:hypothetical protein
MNISKLVFTAAALAVGFGAHVANAAQLNIDTLVYKATPSTSMTKTVEKGPAQLEIDTLTVKATPASSKTRAEVRAELAATPKSKTFTF